MTLKDKLEVIKLCFKYKFELKQIKKALIEECFVEGGDYPDAEYLEAFKHLTNNSHFKKAKKYLLKQYVNNVQTYGTTTDELTKCYGDQRRKEGLMFFFSLAERLTAMEEQKDKEEV